MSIIRLSLCIVSSMTLGEDRAELVGQLPINNFPPFADALESAGQRRFAFSLQIKIIFRTFCLDRQIFVGPAEVTQLPFTPEFKVIGAKFVDESNSFNDQQSLVCLDRFDEM